MEEEDGDEDILQWSKNNRKRHPECTMLVNGCNTTMDYIFYSPANMMVTKLLDVPKLSEITKDEEYLPNCNFPSDHLRI